MPVIHKSTIRRARQAERRHDRNRALTYFLQARDRNPEEPDVHHFLSRIYAEKGEENRSREEETLYRQLKP